MCFLTKSIVHEKYFVGVQENFRSGLCDFPGMFCCMSIGTRNYFFISAGGEKYCNFEAERWNANIGNQPRKDEIMSTEVHEVSNY